MKKIWLSVGTILLLAVMTVSMMTYLRPMEVSAASTQTTNSMMQSTDLTQLKQWLKEQDRQIQKQKSSVNKKTGAEKQKAAAKVTKLKKDYQKVQTRYQKMKQYPAATQVWDYLSKKGYNDYVIAGILGNFMVETGGLTLNLNPQYRDAYYYGLACWSLQYNRQIDGASLQKQLRYLHSTMKQELNAYGFLYGGSGFNFARFKSLKSAEQAALAFAMAYERCSSASYAARQNCAVTAYNYYT